MRFVRRLRGPVMVLAAIAATAVALAYVVGLAAIQGGTAATKAPIAYTFPTTAQALKAEFQCPGTVYHGVRVDHWYIVRVRDSTPRERLIYALCFDGTSWSKYDAKRTREKIARLVIWMYHPTGGPVLGTTQVNFSALEFMPRYKGAGE